MKLKKEKGGGLFPKTTGFINDNSLGITAGLGLISSFTKDDKKRSDKSKKTTQIVDTAAPLAFGAAGMALGLPPEVGMTVGSLAADGINALIPTDCPYQIDGKCVSKQEYDMNKSKKQREKTTAANSNVQFQQGGNMSPLVQKNAILNVNDLLPLRSHNKGINPILLFQNRMRQERPMVDGSTKYEEGGDMEKEGFKNWINEEDRNHRLTPGEKFGIRYKDKDVIKALYNRYKNVKSMKQGGDMACNKPKRTPSHPTKSHVVLACEKGKKKTIRFGQQGVSGSPKKEGESEADRKRRKSFKARHKCNTANSKLSARHWACKVKW